MVTSGSEPSHAGSCFGFSVKSDLVFHYLRDGGGESLEILEGTAPDRPSGELLREWSPPFAPVQMRLYGDGGEFRLWVDDVGWIQVDPARPRITVPKSVDPVRREERIWGIPITLCLLRRGDVPLHAACVEVEGKALLLAAPGRFGKTTLAAAFAQEGYRVLAEDLVCLRPGPEPVVIPGPAMLRVRKDVAHAFRIPGAVELGLDDERVHWALPENRGTCAPVPAAGVAMLLEGSGPPRLDPAPGPEAVRDLWAVSFNLPTNEDRTRCFAAVAGLAASTRIWHFSRERRLEELPASIGCLVDAVRAQR